MSESALQRLVDAAAHAEDRLDALRRRLHGRLGSHGLTLVPYRGYGSLERGVRLRGRVLEGAQPGAAAADDSAWENLLAAYRRLESDEVAGVELEIALGGAVARTRSDSEGYYDVTLRPVTAGAAPGIAPGAALAAGPWLRGSVRVVETGAPQVQAEAEAIVPQAADFAVISDIDDTILVSNATSPLRAARLLLFENARSRAPFAGVATFYQALQRGAGPSSFNPILYVSSSPWNLYDLLCDFLELHAIPAGPLLLRDYGLDAASLQIADHHAHKLARIDEILAVWPALPVVLIGDSGQQDPEIYAEVARAHPDRVRAVYIRDVADDTRDASVRALAAGIAGRGVPLLLFQESAAAQAHARSIGLIAP